MFVVVWISPPLRLFLDQVLEQARHWLFDLGVGG
jgi:hypothetical protein